MNDRPPLYSSRIMRMYLDYLRVTHADVDVRDILTNAGMTAEEVADTAHWFTQQESDRFYAAVVEKTGDANIARKAGRYSVASEGIGLLKQYVASLLSIETAFMSLKKLAPLLTRHATLEVKKTGLRKIEIISTPAPGVTERPYQCDNRLGIIEAMPLLFTNHYAKIEHIACLHRGASVCRYIISWQNPPSLLLYLLRNYTLLGSLALAIGAFFLLPSTLWMTLCMVLLATNLALGSLYTYQKTKELEKIIDYRHDWAEDQIELANTRYNNSLLAQEMGRATVAIYNIDELMQNVAVLMQNRLEFDRGLIMLANEQRSRLFYTAGYGYSDSEKHYLQKTSFYLDRDDSKGFFVRAFHDQTHAIISNAENLASDLSDRSQHMINTFNVRSLLCVPIIYKATSLGILAVDNVKSRAPLKKSDINLLEGIAAQIAIGINHATSFQKLQESEEKYRQTLESINEGYYEIGLDKKIYFANRALCQLLGCSLTDLVASSFLDFFPTQAQQQLTQMLDTIYTTREPVHFYQVAIITPHSEPTPIDLSASLIIDHNGRVTGFRGILRDAAERLQLEKEKKQLEGQLLQAQKMEAIGTLAGGIAHNFNNWLAGILGNITLIRLDAKTNPKIIQRADRIENIIENAAKMTRQLLGYARTGSYKAQRINLNKNIEEVAGTFAETKKEVTITLALEPSLGMVNVDESQIEQVFWNLFVNAIDAMPNGGNLHISTSNTSAKAMKGKPFQVLPGNYAVVEFSDTGTGIAPEDMDNIFEPFFTTKEGQGTGLGLASSFDIVKAHKGYIDVDSQTGRGTTFKVLLPITGDQPQKEAPPAAMTQMGQGTILVVDDENMILETCEQLLIRLGYNVLTAASGREAMEKLQNHAGRIDLVIIDMIMPGMSGRELFTHVKELKPNIKTLLCSGYSLNQNAQEIMGQGCNGFLQKPFNINKLSQSIKRILQPEANS